MKGIPLSKQYSLCMNITVFLCNKFKLFKFRGQTTEQAMDFEVKGYLHDLWRDSGNGRIEFREIEPEAEQFSRRVD